MALLSLGFIPALTLYSVVGSDKSLNFSKPQLSLLYNGLHDISFYACFET